MIQSLLQKVEKAGNLLPHPSLLFMMLCPFVVTLSALFSWFGAEASHPISGEVIRSINLLSAEGLRKIIAEAVPNFIHFAPVGTVLVAIMGIGIAEYSGLLSAVLRALVYKSPPALITVTVVLAGVLSSIGADSGYVVVIPLAAIVFQGIGRPPMLGIAAAFAGVSGGFSANLIFGPVDAMLAGISTEAVALVDKSYVVNATGNYYFICASTLLITLVGTLVTEKIVAPAMQQHATSNEKITLEQLTQKEKKALNRVGLFSIFFIAVLALLLIPENAALRNPDTGGILDSAFIKGIILLIALYAGCSGWIYGKYSGSLASGNDLVKSMETSLATMAGYLVLMFFAAQFVNYFAWSNLGIISAIHGAAWLKTLQPDSTVLLVIFVFLAAAINLLIGSASAKWALIAPVFIPMFYLLGITPEATQMAFRIGDSSTNIITPLMPYFGVVVAFAQRYDKQAGIGTLMAAMLPYSVVFIICWSVLLATWLGLGLPLGPGL